MTNRQQATQLLALEFGEADALEAPLDVKLDQYIARSRKILPEVLAAYDRLVVQLENAAVGGGAPGVGEALPPFALPDDTGRIVHLDDLLAQGSLVVSFNRGHWCPYCRLELRALMRAAPHLRRRPVEIVSILPETADLRDRLVDDNGLPFHLLTDIDLGYALSLGLMMAVNAEVIEVYRGLGIDLPRFQGRAGWFLPIPATFVIGTDRRIKASFVNPDFRRRLTIEQIEAALDA